MEGVRRSDPFPVILSAIAEWNISMMISLARDLRRMIRNQEERKWERTPRFMWEIRGMTLKDLGLQRNRPGNRETR